MFYFMIGLFVLATAASAQSVREVNTQCLSGSDSSDAFFSKVMEDAADDSSFQVKTPNSIVGMRG